MVRRSLSIWYRVLRGIFMCSYLSSWCLGSVCHVWPHARLNFDFVSAVQKPMLFKDILLFSDLAVILFSGTEPFRQLR